jgi:hypothetical protein
MWQWQSGRGGSGRVAVAVGEMVVAGVVEWEIGEMGWQSDSGIVAVAMCQWRCISGKRWQWQKWQGGSGRVAVAMARSGSGGSCGGCCRGLAVWGGGRCQLASVLYMKRGVDGRMERVAAALDDCHAATAIFFDTAICGDNYVYVAISRPILLGFAPFQALWVLETQPDSLILTATLPLPKLPLPHCCS